MFVCIYVTDHSILENGILQLKLPDCCKSKLKPSDGSGVVLIIELLGICGAPIAMVVFVVLPICIGPWPSGL